MVASNPIKYNVRQLTFTILKIAIFFKSPSNKAHVSLAITSETATQNLSSSKNGYQFMICKGIGRIIMGNWKCDWT